MFTLRRAVTVGLLVNATLLGACNAIIGQKDRILDTSGGVPEASTGLPLADAATTPDGGGTEAGSPDATSEAPITVRMDSSSEWRTINGASFTVDGGVAITAFTATHPIVVPNPQPAIADDYTVLATVRAGTAGEFGVVVRIPPSEDQSVLVGSMFGSESRSFIGKCVAPDWNPTDDGRGPTYAFVAGRYKLRLQAAGTTVSGKLWQADQSEPESFQVTTIAGSATARGVGFYTYGVADAVLESMVVTFP
jgi:hypothetical protein